MADLVPRSDSSTSGHRRRRTNAARPAVRSAVFLRISDRQSRPQRGRRSGARSSRGATTRTGTDWHAVYAFVESFSSSCTPAIDKKSGLRAIACPSSRVTVSRADSVVVPDPRAEDARLALAEPGENGPEIPAKGLHRARPFTP